MHSVLLAVWLQWRVPHLIHFRADGFETQHHTTATDGALGHDGHVAYGIPNDAGDGLALLLGLLVRFSDRR